MLGKILIFIGGFFAGTIFGATVVRIILEKITGLWNRNLYKYINIIYFMSDEKIRCKQCGSTQTYIRILTNERVCKSCGYVEEIKSEGIKSEGGNE